MKRLLSLVISLLLLATLAACKTVPPVDWQARVGHFTFDQAVQELGPPEKSASLTDGTRVADWLTARGQRHVTYHSLPGGRVIQMEGARDPDRLLRLTFGPDGQLRDWKSLWR
jgi:hypothetical protein